MKDFLIFHLPLKRDNLTPPVVTVAFRRNRENKFSAGVAICNNKDQFSKKAGRAIATERLRGKPFVADDASDLLYSIYATIIKVMYRRLDKGEHILNLLTSANDVTKLRDKIANMHVTYSANNPAPGTYVRIPQEDGSFTVGRVV